MSNASSACGAPVIPAYALTSITVLLDAAGCGPRPEDTRENVNTSPGGAVAPAAACGRMVRKTSVWLRNSQ